MPGPLIGITTWHREVATLVGPAEPMFTLDVGYAEAVAAAGAVPVLLPNLDPAVAAETIDRLDGLLLSGGGDIDPARYGAHNTRSTDIDARRDRWELSLAAAAAEAGVPTLGICRGLQMLNVAAGGTLRQHVWTDGGDHPDLLPAGHTHLEVGRHEVAFEEGSRLRTVYGVERRVVNSLHHQGIDRLADRFAATARTPGGAIEGIEATDGWEAMAVQWHPERLPADDERPLFEAFVAAARA